MPRTPRKISSTGFYHIMLRRNNKQQVFFDEEDYQKFYSLLVQYKTPCGYKCHAWCLMPNHVHLLFEIHDNMPGIAMRHIVTGYVVWYNRKYDRGGHLFEGRYKSEPIESVEYFLKAFRYINMNPVKGGICQKPEDYRFSSYNTYFNSGRFPSDYLFFGLYSKEEFEKFHLEKNDDQFLDLDYYYQKDPNKNKNEMPL